MRLNKSLGQNFFNNQNLAKWIVDNVMSEKPKSIIEIGPGDGYFTKIFLDKLENITVIEKDLELATFLSQKFPNLKIVNTDILLWEDSLDTYIKPLVIYGSLPYNISKRIISKYIKLKGIKAMYFIIQKEVAQKYISHDNHTSTLSVMTSLYAKVELLKIIKPGNFIPKPKVDSALVKITPIERGILSDTSKVEKVVKQAFTNPRKTLRNNLKTFNLSNIDPELLNKRPENLSTEEYIELSNRIVL